MPQKDAASSFRKLDAAKKSLSKKEIKVWRTRRIVSASGGHAEPCASCCRSCGGGGAYPCGLLSFFNSKRGTEKVAAQTPTVQRRTLKPFVASPAGTPKLPPKAIRPTHIFRPPIPKRPPRHTPLVDLCQQDYPSSLPARATAAGDADLAQWQSDAFVKHRSRVQPP